MDRTEETERQGRSRRPAAGRSRVLALSALSVLAALVSGVVLTGCGSLGLAAANGLARFGRYQVERDLAYGADPRQRADVYRPPGASDAPVVVFFYGGGWRGGSKRDYVFAAQALTSRGFVAVVPDYRTFPEVRFPEFVYDGARAVAWARERAGRFGGDPDSIFVMGHSAGAHIAALLALDARYLESAGIGPGALRGMIGLAGPYDFNALREDLRPIFENAPLEATQPLTYAAGSEGIPLLLLHGEEDRTVFVKNTVRLAAAVRAAGGRVRTGLYPDVDHVGLIAALSIPLRGSSSVLDDVARFVREHAPAETETPTAAMERRSTLR